VFSVVAIVYTTMGGMWSVAFTDVMQFVFMLGGALIVLPIAMSSVGWWPGMAAKLPPEALTLVRASGTYSWKFIIAIFLLGIEWACVDQGLLQRAFGAESPRTVARGLVLAGIITTPFALLWNIPGLAAGVLYPGLQSADMAVPTLLANLIPNVVLGLVVCGLLSSHLSTISANLNGVATIVASDLYENLLNRKATDRDVLRVARVVTALTGAAMIFFAYLVPRLGGAVEAYLTVIAIMDMPLFVVAILFGLLWRRTNWQGAVAGYAAGAIAGVSARQFLGFDFTLTTFVSAGATLVVTPAVTFFFAPPEEPQVAPIWNARRPGSGEEAHERYNIIPVTPAGKLALGTIAAGLIIFLGGVFMGSAGLASASFVAVGGMVIYFFAGLWRAYTD
jgi:SSS family solute:Na+ symporter